MIYLITEFAIYLGGAALIGFLTGWFAQRARLQSQITTVASEPAGVHEAAEELTEQLEWMKERLREQETEGNETVGRMASEMEHLRPILESLSSGMQESARDMNADRDTRERAEKATRELEEIRQKFQLLTCENEKLKTNYDKIADRIVEYEKERVGGHTPKAVAPRAEPERAEETRSRDTSPPPNETAFDGLPKLERSTPPSFNAPLDLEMLDDLQRSASPTLVDPVAANPRDGETASAAEVRPPTGTTRSLDLISEIPKDVLSRLEILGLKTNIDLVTKCRSRSGLSALSKSMGLSTDTLAEWVAVADLLRLEGIRRDDFPHLIEIGINSVSALAKASAEDLDAKLRGLEDVDDLPPLETISKWIEEASDLAERTALGLA